MCPPESRPRYLIIYLRRQMRLVDDGEHLVRPLDAQRRKPTVLDHEDAVIRVAHDRRLVLGNLDDDEAEELDDGV